MTTYDEQARRGEFTDVYALAATYYCLVTGKMPPAAFMRVVNDKLVPPQEANDRIAVSDVASGAMLAGLQVRGEDRPQSVSEWLGLLQVDTDDLSSERGVDYRRLRDLLKAYEWVSADCETGVCMLKAAGQEEKVYLDKEDIDNFPCTDLRTIDRLWVKYSNGRFGFSVFQKRIKEQRTKEYKDNVWKAFWGTADDPEIGWELWILDMGLLYRAKTCNL